MNLHGDEITSLFYGDGIWRAITSIVIVHVIGAERKSLDKPMGFFFCSIGVGDIITVF